jgi:isoleucyl-tRNA synthetase
MSDRPNFPQIEEELLKNWEANKIFEQTLAKEAPKGRFVFFEGPPTANGRPGIHHVESRAFKDCLLRFRTMQGYFVERKAGWDTHGLPVEIEVEKQLGFSGKKDIENFGIEAFNKKCRESVWKYLEEWNAITKRIAFWLDLEKPYVTYHSEYVESLWWIIKQIWDKGLLYQDYKVVPYCPRCGTSLSSHELAQGYKEVEDPAIYIKFKVTKSVDGSVPAEAEYLVAWTTTPWTLPANVALAVGVDITYVKVKHKGDLLWVAKSRVE